MDDLHAARSGPAPPLLWTNHAQPFSLFAGLGGGGRSWATIAPLLQTCKMNDVDPVRRLTQTLERIGNQWPSAEIDAPMPCNCRL